MEKSEALYPSKYKHWDKNRDKSIIDPEIPNLNAYDYFVQKTTEMNNWDGIALEWLDFHMTYQELLDNVNDCIEAYRAIGVKKGDIVPVLSDSYPHIVISFLALIKLGAIQTNLDKNLSEQELMFYLEKYKSKRLVLYGKELNKYRNVLDQSNLDQIIITSPKDYMQNYKQLSEDTQNIFATEDVDFEENENYMKWSNGFLKAGLGNTSELISTTNGEYPSYIGYTSGTTGQPNPVLLSSRNMIAMAIKIALSLNIEYGKNKT